MTTENITISKDFLLNAYRKAEPAQKELLKELFGADTFAINVMDRVKTFQDAVVELGNDNPLVKQYNQFYSEFGDMMDTDIIAYLKLRIITAALNEGWEPQYKKDEYRYYPFFILLSKKEYDELKDDEWKRCVGRSGVSTAAGCGLVYADTDSGIVCGGAHSDSLYSHSYGDVRLTFKTRELAEYAGKQFLKIWADFVFKISKDKTPSDPFCAAP